MTDTEETNFSIMLLTNKNCLFCSKIDGYGEPIGFWGSYRGVGDPLNLGILP